MANIIEILIRADDKASKQLKVFGGNIENVSKQVADTSAKIAMAGLAVGAAIGGIVYKTAKHNDELAKTAKQLGVSTEFLSEYEHAIKLSGGELSDIVTGIKRMSRAASDANFGLATYTRTFDDLGISVTDNNGNLKDSEILFLEAADAISQMDNDTRKAAVAQELFGRGGLKLIPMLNEGVEGMEEMREEARRLGISLSAEAAKKSEDFIDSLTRLKGSIRGVGMELTEQLEGPISEYIDKIATITIPETGKWVRENEELISTLLKVGSAITITSIATSGLIKLFGAAAAHPWALAIVASIGLITASLATVPKSMRDIKEETDEMSKSIWGATDNLKIFEEQITGTTDELADFKKEAKETGEEVDELHKKLQEKIELTKIELPDFKFPELELPELSAVLSIDTSAIKDIPTQISGITLKVENLEEQAAELFAQFVEGKITLREWLDSLGMTESATDEYNRTLQEEEEQLKQLIKRLQETQNQMALVCEEAAKGWDFDPGTLSYMKIIEDTPEIIKEINTEWQHMPELINTAGEAAEDFEDVLSRMDVSSEDVAMSITSNLGSAFREITMEIFKTDSAFGRMAASIMADIGSMMVKMIAWRALFSIFGGGPFGFFGQQGMEFVGPRLPAQRGLEAVSGIYGVDTIPVAIGMGEVVMPSPTVEDLKSFMEEQRLGPKTTINVTPLFMTGSKMQAYIIGEYLKNKRDNFEPYIVPGNL